MNGRTRDIIRILGMVCTVLGASMIAPLLLAILYKENESFKAFGSVIVMSAVLGLIIRFTIRPSQEKLKARDGFIVVSASWLLSSVLGALPFVFCESIPHFIDAFFEACSGFSTTGATILTDIESLPKSLLFWRSFTHWLGGMGIIVFVMALLPALGINGQIVANAETPGPTKDKVTAKFSDTAKGLYEIYIGFTVVEVILLKFGGLSWYDAFVHTFGTVGTGGFSSYNASIGQFNSIYIYCVIIVFMILAGMNFNLFYMMKKRGFFSIFKDEEARFYLIVLGAASGIIFIANSITTHFQDVIKTLVNAVFQVTSIMTTTGYATDDFDKWPMFSRMVLLCLFFIGGCSSSTGGGVKCVRIVVALKLIRRGISLRIHPNRIAPISLNEAELPTDVVIKITSFIFTYIFVFFTGTLLISLNNFDLVTTFSTAITCLGNIGPGFNLVGPSMNFSILSDFSKLVCSFLMIAGRLELFTVFALFSKYYWNSNRSN